MMTLTVFPLSAVSTDVAIMIGLACGALIMSFVWFALCRPKRATPLVEPSLHNVIWPNPRYNAIRVESEPIDQRPTCGLPCRCTPPGPNYDPRVWVRGVWGGTQFDFDDKAKLIVHVNGHECHVPIEDVVWFS